MPKRLTLLLCVLMLCAVSSLSPLGVVVPTKAALVAPANDALKELLLATSRASMQVALKGTLLQLLNSANQRLAMNDDTGAGTDLFSYIALLKAYKGSKIAPRVADELILAAEAALVSVLHPYADDYDRVPIVGALPATVTAKDWRANGAITPVKNQGQCQSDYAFSTTGAVESAWAIKKGQLVSLSEQQLIDCSAENNGCNGGSPVRALEYLIQKGSASESSYPYTARDGTCKTFTPVVTISSFSRPQPGDEEALRGFVQWVGPVSVVLRVRSSAWDSYAGGIIDPTEDPSVMPRYITALIVGFGEQSGQPYWIVKNSIGTSWGAQGYVFIPRGQNAFGIADFVVCPIV